MKYFKWRCFIKPNDCKNSKHIVHTPKEKYTTMKLDEVILVQADEMTKDEAWYMSKRLDRTVIYLKDINSISSVSLDELQKIIDDERKIK